MMLIADGRLVGIALLVEAIVPLGDMSIILGSGGAKSRAFSVHGVTCAVMLVVGPLLLSKSGHPWCYFASLLMLILIVVIYARVSKPLNRLITEDARTAESTKML